MLAAQSGSGSWSPLVVPVGEMADPPDGNVWALRYRLHGEVAGAPRTVRLWLAAGNGRAVGDDGTCWAWSGTDMTIVREGFPTEHLVEGAGDVYRPPFPEARAIQSVDQACSWLDKPVPSTRAAGVVLARSVAILTGTDVRLVVDEESGVVLGVEAIGLRGEMSLTVDEFGLVEFSHEMFTCPVVDRASRQTADTG